MSNFATDDTSTDNPVQSHHSGDLHCEAHSQAQNKEQSPRDAIELLPDEEVQDLPPLPPATDSEYSEDEEWDETPTALQLRALFTLLAGGFLLWSQLRAGFRPGAEWNRWVALSFVANLALPLGIVWLFFAQGVGYVSELKNQGLNAWNYGWNFRDWKTHVKWTLGMFVLMLPALWFAAQDATARDYYAIYFPSAQNVACRGCCFRSWFICSAGSGSFAASCFLDWRRVSVGLSRCCCRRYSLAGRTPASRPWSFTVRSSGASFSALLRGGRNRSLWRFTPTPCCTSRGRCWCDES
jgi:hypothetical protein